MRRLLSLLVVLLIGLASVQPASAHANLYRADPPPNAPLERAPEAIHLWFTEPLEAEFSAITLTRANGDPVDTPASSVNPDDPTQMTLVPGDLPDGLYTVSWRALSAADGHQTRGSYAFSIGAAAGAALAEAQVEAVQSDDVLMRWFNLFSMSLMTGGIGFYLFVWRPSRLPTDAYGRMHGLIVVGWALLGAANIISLLVYTGSFAEISPLAALGDPALGRVLSATRFGQLWAIRAGLWLVQGIVLMLARRQPNWHLIALVIGAAILWTQSQYAHASAVHDPHVSVMSDWLHLLATAFWLGGLAQLVNVIPVVRQAQAVGALTGWFSNYGRACVAALIITGLYAAWLHVGTVDALLNTIYGRALLVKLILIIPLLAIAAVNLVVTYRALRAGKERWAGILRGLVAAEIALLALIFAAVAIMTSANPARAVEASRQEIEDNTFAGYNPVDGNHVHFIVTPGWVGQNEFTVQLFDNRQQPIDDASLIRVRFDHLTRNLGQSELRPQPVGEGKYTIEGANLSQPGEWRARITIQRPGEFDMVTDFTLDMELPPIPEGLDTGAPLDGHVYWQLFTGIGLVIVGVFTVGRKWLKLWDGIGVFGLASAFVGIALILNALSHPNL